MYYRWPPVEEMNTASNIVEEMFQLVRDIIELEGYIERVKGKEWDDAIFTVISNSRKSIFKRAEMIWENIRSLSLSKSIPDEVLFKVRRNPYWSNDKIAMYVWEQFYQKLFGNKRNWRVNAD